MIDQLFDVITKLSSYAMVIFFALFAYSKIVKKPQKYPYGKYALVSLLLMIVFGTLFFNSPRGKAVLKRGAQIQSSQTTSSHQNRATTTAVRKTVKSTTLLFTHHLTLTERSGVLEIRVRDQKDTLTSFKLTTVAIIKAIKHSDYQKYKKFKIRFEKATDSGIRPVLSLTITSKAIAKADLNHLKITDLKRISENYYEAH